MGEDTVWKGSYVEKYLDTCSIVILAGCASTSCLAGGEGMNGSPCGESS